MTGKALLTFCSFLLLAALTEVSASGASAVAKLIKDLQVGYEKIAYPDGITLHIGVTYVCAYMDEEHGRLSSRVIERYHWEDHRLTWDPKKYEGVDKLSIPARHIWTPDVHLQNSIMTEDRDEVNAIVLANGSIYWIPPVNYKTRCADLDTHEDSYHCKLSLGSWTYDAHSIPLELFYSGFDTRMYIDSCPYTIENAKFAIKNTKYECCEKPYGTLNIEFDVHKKKEEVEDDDDDDDDDDDHHHGYRARYSSDCEWPHCELY